MEYAMEAYANASPKHTETSGYTTLHMGQR